MARNTNGWIRIDRKLGESDIVEHGPVTFSLWIHLLLMANYADSKRCVGTSALRLKAGQLVTGIKELEKKVGTTESKVRRSLLYLKTTGRISDLAGPQGRVITILKWDRYQLDHEQNVGHPSDPQLTPVGPSTDGPLTYDGHPSTSEQVNNVTIEPSNKETMEQGKLFHEGEPSPAPKVKKPRPKIDPSQSDLNKRVWQSYEDAYLKRYGIKPTRNLTVNSQISNLGKRLGEDAIAVVAFYVGHNESFYLKKCHAVGPCLSDAESLKSQWERNVQVTSTKVRQFEKSNSTREMLKHIEENGI